MRPGQRIGYFGKLPSRSDFVKAGQDVALLGVLDNWLAQVMDALPANARWKACYDALEPVSFAFVGPRRRHAIGGHLVASRDTSGRRFPFLIMRTVEVADPAAFARHCPMALAPLWGSMAAAASTLLAAGDPAPCLQRLGETDVGPAAHCAAALAGFLDTGTVGSLAGLLARDDTRQVIMAVGLLLQPVMAFGPDALEKSLVLPLPENESAAHAVASFWLELVMPFLGGADVELALFICRSGPRPALVIGFNGASVRTLRAIIDPEYAEEQQVGVQQPGWVDEPGASGLDVRQLSSYLEQPQLPLKMARDLFLEAFTKGAA